MRRGNRQNSRGGILIMLAVAVMAIAAMGGLAIDSALMVAAKTRLTAAADSAALAAARAPSADRVAAANSAVAANFPNGTLGANPVLTGPTVAGNRVSVLVSASIPTYLMRFAGKNTAKVAASAEAQTASDPVVFLIIDEDAIDNGAKSIEDISFKSPFCGNKKPDVCVNDDKAADGYRQWLFSRGTSVMGYSGLKLDTGQTGDPGLFRFDRADPQVSQQTGATFTTAQFLNASGSAASQGNLDKITGVRALSATDITALKDKRVCGVVFDSDVSFDASDNYGVLQGATMGKTAFRVTATQSMGGSTLPRITVSLLSSAEATTACSEVGSAGTGGGAAFLVR